MPEVDCTVRYASIPQFPKYMAGSDGTIWSRHGGSWRQLKPRRDARNGRLQVTLCPGYHQRQIHRLILEAFVGPCPPGMEACHFPDKDTANNRLDNLRWDTKAGNQADKDKHGTQAVGEDNGNAKATAEVVAAIRCDYATGCHSHRTLSRKYSLSRATIHQIVNGVTWKHI
jgi:hypothetical protein